ncbi:hypothetical protein PV328_008289 [Microctonus aethiopoides]|nr:hypothetical protein PV328_008289 [Microctonus aethiopoides]
MDTIFVKQVRTNSPASEAGLRTGDRVVSVDGVPTRGEQYASVVQRIQQAGAWLRLLVVSKEDDILQRYFGDAAHNPETNQRPARLRSPERLSQKQRRSMSMIPGPSPSRSRQSWLCQTGTISPGLENQGNTGQQLQQQHRIRDETLLKDQSANKMTTSAPNIQRRPLTEARNHETIHGRSENDRQQRRSLPQQQELIDANINQYHHRSPDNTSRYDLYDRTRPESIYSRPSSEQIYDRIKDPIYERVRPDLNTFSKSLDHQYPPMSRAEPQVPIYRPGRRVVTRRASEGSGPINDLDTNETAYLTNDLFKIDPGSRLSVESRRDSSPASKDSSLSSYDSNSTLTGNECSDDSVIMTRLRKSFEQKEEFLRRPSHPIGWLLPDDIQTQLNQTQGVIQREFYARPQKLQRQVWPPNEQQQIQSSQTNSLDRMKNCKPVNQCIQRVRDETTGVGETGNNTKDGYNGDRNSIDDPQALRDKFYSSLYDNNGQFIKENHFSYSPMINTSGTGSTAATTTTVTNKITNDMQKNSSSGRNLGSNKNAFVTTLSRIHENVSSAVQQQNINQQQLQDEGQEKNGTLSLPGSPGLDKKSDKFPIPPQGLQIVSRRAKQFESGRLLSDDDEPTSDRTNLYKSELSRLSNKRSVPNVAVRKREFESKAESQDTRRITANRESKSLDSDAPAMDMEPVRLRARSNSAESWEAANGDNSSNSGGGTTRRGVRHTWQTEPDDQEGETRNTKTQRQDSYLQAVRTQLVPATNANTTVTNTNGVVLRRQKNTQITDEERAMRRVSYLKATWGERMHVDSDLELSDSEPVVQSMRSNIAANTHGGVTSNAAAAATTTTTKDIEPVEREGSIHVKFTVLDGKRSTDRSWKQVWGVLRGPILYFFKDRHSQSPSATSDSDAGQNVDVRCSLVDVADDYTKRKHVLRVANPTAEVLLQTEDAASMALWLRALHKHVAAEKLSDSNSSTSKQQAVPQTPGPTTPISSANISGAGVSSGQRLSPLPSHKGIRKLTSFRNRSPTGQSPVNKTRKPSQTVEQLPSPKSKTWKGRVAKQLRRMHGQAGSPSSPTAQLPPEGATFKVPLELCPMSSFSEFVPLIVEMCTSIVEARGLEVIGIYRVPGNTAAISQLTESVNKGFENINLQDPRWSDVNVISSLLKSFFRQLPDSLLTADLYPMFIDADKIEDPQRRMATIRKLLRDLPEHHFETLKCLMFHLKRVVDHSEVNKMEAKNLAIVFGPTLVRASGSRDNMVTMVTDMSHQCRIVESLLNNVDWFFCEEDLDDLSRLSVNLSLPADGSEVESNSNHNLLLNNIQKVEGMREMVSAKDIVSSIISAANRKIQRRRKGQEEQETEEHEEEKNKAKPDESLGVIRQSMALNERQCSVSEMVLMHENKNQPNNTNDRGTNATIISTNTNGSANGSPLNNSTSSNRSKYSNTSMQNQQQMQLLSNTSSLSLDSPRNESSTNSLDTVSLISTTSNDTKQSNEDVAIRTYAGLSATTQERIRRFEQETKAMLQRDQHRQRREAEKREEERRRIGMEWQLAKREMENDDILDGIVDTAVCPPYIVDRLTNINERIVDGNNGDRHRSKSTTRLTPLSIAVQQQPTSRQKAQATNQLTNIIGEKINNGIIKKFKTDKEPSMESLALTRYGSLDSLHDVHTSPSPSHQTRGVPGDISDDGSDLLTSLTSTFDRKWKSLVNPTTIIVTSAETCNNVMSGNSENIKQNNCDNIDRGLLITSATTTTTRQSEVYRDPSLHKSLVDKNYITRTKNDALDEKLGMTEKSNESITPDNDRNLHRNTVETNALATDSSDGGSLLDATEKDESPKCAVITKSKRLVVVINKTQDDEISSTSNDEDNAISNLNDTDERKTIHDSSSYTNKLEKFESLSQANESRSRLKRSESLNKRTEMSSSKLKRSESLNKHSDRLASPTNGKLKRSESLNKHAERSESPNMKLKRSESLTKTEKTECNISKRRQSVRKETATKLKRKNGMPERSIKRRHTVGGTKDFDKVHWLDNKLQSETERVIKNDIKPKKSQLRTSSPDLSSNRVNVTDTSFLIEVSFRGPSNVVFNVTNTRPQSLPDANLASKVFKVPLESHV